MSVVRRPLGGGGRSRLDRPCLLIGDATDPRGGRQVARSLPQLSRKAPVDLKIAQFKVRRCPVPAEEQWHLEPGALAGAGNLAAGSLPVPEQVSGQEQVRIIDQVNVEEIAERLIDLERLCRTRYPALLERRFGDPRVPPSGVGLNTA